jgi:hypothetical protein
MRQSTDASAVVGRAFATGLGVVGSLAATRELQDDRVVDEPVDGRGGGHGVLEDPIPIRRRRGCW